MWTKGIFFAKIPRFSTEPERKAPQIAGGMVDAKYVGGTQKKPLSCVF